MTRCEEVCHAAPGCAPCSPTGKPLSQSIADVADAVERQAIAEGYAGASRFVRPLMQNLPDGRVAVGAMDGFTAQVPSPATLANGEG